MQTPKALGHVERLVTLMAPRTFRFASFTLDVERQCLYGPSGEANLRPKTFEVLQYLIQHAGPVVSKQELLNAIWQAVTVTEESLTRCISEIRCAMGDEGQNIIKTVSKRGYRFDASVTADDVPTGRPATTTKPRAAVKFLASSLPLPDQPSIAVLPFVNMSGDADQDYFADGMTEEIITALSKWRWFFVIARNTTFTYKGRSIDVRQIGQDLGVRYVLEGSVRNNRDRDRVRITAQLIEAATGQHIWADRFDGQLKDVFGLQDEITQRVVNAVDPAIRMSEIRRAARKPTENMDAWDHFLRGSFCFFSYRKPAMAAAREQFQRAIEIDPQFAPAHARLAGAHGFEGILGWSDRPRDSLEAAYQCARTAIALDDLDASAHAASARALLWTRRHEPALESASRAVHLNPNFHEGHSLLGQCLTFGGRPVEASSPFETALRLSPRDPLAWAAHGLSGLAHYISGHYEPAIDAAEKALALRPYYAVGRVVKAASLFQLGEAASAREELALVSSASLDRLESFWPFRNDADLQHLMTPLITILAIGDSQIAAERR